MFLNILRISASNVLKMFLNIVVSTGQTVVILIPFVQTWYPDVTLPRKKFTEDNK